MAVRVRVSLYPPKNSLDPSAESVYNNSLIDREIPMKKYAVALYSNFDGSMLMDTVYAKSELEAGKQFLLSQGDNTVTDMINVNTLDELQQYVFDQDHAIGVLAVNETDWKKYSNATSSAMPVSIQ